MKLKLLIVAIVVVGLSSCTQKTCPTYAKSTITPTEKPAQV